MKSEGEKGLLTRRHIVVNKTDVCHIGKETNELEDAQIMSVSDGNYTIYEDLSSIYNKILALKAEEARILGISTRTLYYWKMRIRDGKHIKFKFKV